jgi:hypothetical protein
MVRLTSYYRNILGRRCEERIALRRKLGEWIGPGRGEGEVGQGGWQPQSEVQDFGTS